MKYLLTLLIALFASNIFAQGEIFKEKDADKILGKVVETKVLTVQEFKNIFGLNEYVQKARTEKVMSVNDKLAYFKFEKDKLVVKNTKEMNIALKKNVFRVDEASATSTTTEVYRVISTDKILELLKLGGSDTIEIQIRSNRSSISGEPVISFKNGVYVLDRAADCPPLCPCPPICDDVVGN